MDQIQLRKREGYVAWQERCGFGAGANLAVTLGLNLPLGKLWPRSLGGLDERDHCPDDVMPPYENTFSQTLIHASLRIRTLFRKLRRLRRQIYFAPPTLGD